MWLVATVLDSVAVDQQSAIGVSWRISQVIGC